MRCPDWCPYWCQRGSSALVVLIHIGNEFPSGARSPVQGPHTVGYTRAGGATVSWTRVCCQAAHRLLLRHLRAPRRRTVRFAFVDNVCPETATQARHKTVAISIETLLPRRIARRHLRSVHG